MPECSPPSPEIAGTGFPQLAASAVAARRSLAAVGRTWLRTRHVHRFEAATRAVRSAQEGRLLSILHANRNTAYGRLYGFGKIRSVREFQSRVPIVEYDAIKPYVQRTMQGESGVLTREVPLMFAITSGTTGEPKYIPITPTYLAEYNHAVQVHTWKLVEDYPDIVLGSVLLTSSCDVEGHTEGGIPFGAISGFLARRQPPIVKRWFALPDGVGRIKDLEAKYYLSLLLALRQDLRLAISVSPTSLVLLADKLQAHGARLVRDLHDGTIAEEILSRPAARKMAQEQLRPDPGRARRLERVLEREGMLQPKDAWPNLQAMCCWKGGTMSLYLERLRRAWGEVPVRDFGYMASEGRGSIPLADEGAVGPLALTSHFFEFIPTEETDRSNPITLTADQLEEGEEYFVLFTTSSGLYRYHINDIVRVTGCYRSAPMIEFVRKGQGVSSVAGEKLTEPQVTASILSSARSSGVRVKHFSAAPQWGDPPHYVLLVELDGTERPEAAHRLARTFDRELAERNVEYRSKRESCRLGMPTLQVVPSGTFDRYRQERVLAGAPEAQVKIPHLSPDLNWASEFRASEEYAR